MGEATEFISKAAAEIVLPTMRASLQGEALTFCGTVSDLTIPCMGMAVFVMYVILTILYERYVHPRTFASQ
jgi:multidrug efflux pump subunit AcrB